MALDIIIAILLAAFTILMAFLGVYVTLHPAESDQIKRKYKVGFGLCALAACGLIGWQTYRNGAAQSELRQELGRIESNTNDIEQGSAGFLQAGKINVVPGYGSIVTGKKIAFNVWCDN